MHSSGIACSVVCAPHSNHAAGTRDFASVVANSSPWFHKLGLRLGFGLGLARYAIMY